MIFKSIVTLAVLSSFVAAGPVEHERVKEQIRKRQTGAIPGLPDALAGFVPMIANSGMLPTIVKTFINCRSPNTMMVCYVDIDLLEQLAVVKLVMLQEQLLDLSRWKPEIPIFPVQRQ